MPEGWFEFRQGIWRQCVRISAASTLPGERLTVSELAGTTLEASADTSGEDAVVMTAPSGNATAVGAGNLLSLGSGWKAAEFAIVGDGNGTQAKFSANTTMTVQTAVKSTSNTPPACVNEGFTGETNNLNLEGTPALSPQHFPTVASQQTNGSATSASCATASGGPSVSITTPPEGGSYSLGQTVDASYSCNAAPGGTLESCTGTVPDGSPIDTSAGPSHTFSVTATDTDGQTSTVTHIYTINGIEILTSSLPPATRGSSYSMQLEAKGGTQPYKWKKTAKLPKGLKLSKSGLLSGVPSTKLTAGEYPVAVTVADSTKKTKQTGTATFTLSIS